MACGGRTSSGKGGVPRGRAGGMTSARVLAGGPRVGKTSCSGVLVRPGTSHRGSVSVETSPLVLWAHGVGVHADAPAHSFPTNADARGEAVRTMPRTLACYPPDRMTAGGSRAITKYITKGVTPRKPIRRVLPSRIHARLRCTLGVPGLCHSTPPQQLVTRTAIRD